MGPLWTRFEFLGPGILTRPATKVRKETAGRRAFASWGRRGSRAFRHVAAAPATRDFPDKVQCSNEIQDQVVLGQNPAPVIATTTTESMATKLLPRAPPGAEPTCAPVAVALRPSKGPRCHRTAAAEKSPQPLVHLAASGPLIRRAFGCSGARTQRLHHYRGKRRGYVLTNKLFALAMAPGAGTVW